MQSLSVWGPDFKNFRNKRIGIWDSNSNTLNFKEFEERENEFLSLYGIEWGHVYSLIRASFEFIFSLIF